MSLTDSYFTHFGDCHRYFTQAVADKPQLALSYPEELAGEVSLAKLRRHYEVEITQFVKKKLS